MALHPSLLTSAAIPPLGPDADLIDACNTFAAHEIERNNPSITDDQMDEMCDRIRPLAEPVLTGRATTPEGIAAKVRASVLYFERFSTGLTGELLTSLFRDMLNLPDDPEPEEGELEAAPAPDPADPRLGAPNGAAWRKLHPVWEGGLPPPEDWAEQARADLPLIRLCRAWQLKPCAEIDEAFRVDPVAMTKTTAALTDLSVHGGDKPGHWSGGVVLSAAE